MTEQEAAVLLSLIPGVKPAILREIYGQMGSYIAYFDRQLPSLPPHIEQPFNHYCKNRSELNRQLEGRLDYLKQQQIELLSLADPGYPLLLREIHRPPPVIYVKGEVEVLALPQVAIVGSRKASRSGVQLAEQFASALAQSGFAVTSGLALGIDGAAHRGALQKGKTIAVLGTGVDVVYPRQHRRLCEDILASGGAVVSEFPPGTEPLRHHFPQRNRVISGLSLGILIVEAAAQSGSLITARLAMEQGREVFAVPGSVHNPMARGCHQLIREGAILTETLEDIVSQLGGMLAFKAEEVTSEAGQIGALSKEEAGVLEAVSYDPVDVDTLQALLDIDVADLTVVLVNLEMQGLIENLGGNYLRIR